MQANFTHAVTDWKQVLKFPEQILLEGIESVYQPNISEYSPVPISAVVKPYSVTEVQQIVKIANEYAIPLYPISTGKNWGQGSKQPLQPNSVIVDLAHLNTVRTTNEKFRYAVIEAGVTQRQLAEALVHSDLMLPMTGSGNDTSVVGNLIERGATFFAHRNNLLLGVEVVLGNGELVRTGLWHFFDDKIPVEPFIYHAAGVGANINGLFTQSNFGIVTAMVVQLLPRTKGTIVYLEANEKQLTPLIDTLRSLKDEGITTDFLLLTNKNDPRTTTAGQYVYTGDWVAFTTITGSLAMQRVAQAEIKQRLQDICYHFLFIEDDTPDESLYHDYFRVVRKLYQGMPSDYSLETMAGIFRVTLQENNKDIDYYDQIPGFSVVLLAVPYESSTIQQIISTVNLVSTRLGVQAFHNFATLSSTSMEGYYRMYFNRKDAKQVAVAHQWNTEVCKALEQIGVFPYRLNHQQMNYFTDREGDSYWQLLADIKTVVDPKGIISPKKYNKK